MQNAPRLPQGTARARKACDPVRPVFGAQLRHNEALKQEAISSQPTAAKAYSPVHVLNTDLASLAFLSRKVLLLGLSKSSGTAIDEALFGIDSKRVLLEEVAFQMRLAPHTTVELIVKES